MKYISFIFSLLLFISCSTAQHYSTKSKKAIKLFEQGKNEPSNSIDQSTHRPNYKLGLKYLEQAIEKDPRFWEAHMVAGEFAEIIGDYPKAINHFEKALAINPQLNSSGSTYFYLGNLQHAVGDYEMALKNLDLFQRFKNPNPDLVKQSYKIQSDCEFAIEATKNPLSFNPIKWT